MTLQTARDVLRDNLDTITDSRLKTATEIAIKTIDLELIKIWEDNKSIRTTIPLSTYMGYTNEEYCKYVRDK